MQSIPTQSIANIPQLSVAELQEVDRRMAEELGVPVPLMMENAARNIALMTHYICRGSVEHRHIIVCAGKGNNGGDGLAAARHLANRGALVTAAVPVAVDELHASAQQHAQILQRLHVPLMSPEEINLSSADLLIDSLLGSGIAGSPREPAATLIQEMNTASSPILAVDVPSGLDADTGTRNAPTISAEWTLTFGYPTHGLLTKAAQSSVGKLYLGDISVPPWFISRAEQMSPLFAQSPIIRLTS